MGGTAGFCGENPEGGGAERRVNGAKSCGGGLPPVGGLFDFFVGWWWGGFHSEAVAVELKDNGMMD